MKKKSIKILFVIAVLIVALVSYLLYAWYGETHTGSRSGRVIDAATGEPVEGAVVIYAWDFSGVLGVAGGETAAFCETKTDKDGYYFVPNKRVKKRTLFISTLKRESVLIYKDNYAAYTLFCPFGSKTPVGISYGHHDKDQEYREINNAVKLYLWKEGQSHRDHVNWIRSLTHSIGASESLMKELEKERTRARQEPLTKNR